MKEFKTHNQQLRILRSRGLAINNGAKMKRILEKENYYNVINGYKYLFIDKTYLGSSEMYKVGTTFEEVFTLFTFDRDLRGIILKYALVLEQNFKSIISYCFSEKYGADKYLKMSSFNDLKQTGATPKKLMKRNKEISGLIAKLQSDIAFSSDKKEYIMHYLHEYGFVPLWVLFNAVTLGSVSKFYNLIKDSEKVKIARQLKVSKDSLQQYIKVLSVIRNICAHDERLYDIKLKNGYELPDMSYHSLLSIPKTTGKFDFGKNDLYTVVLIYKELLPKKEFRQFFTILKRNIDKLDNNLNVISSTDVLGEMGFPTNWEEIVDL